MDLYVKNDIMLVMNILEFHKEKIIPHSVNISKERNTNCALDCSHEKTFVIN